MKRVHDYGLKQIGIGLGLIAALLLLTACHEKEEEVIVLDGITVTPEPQEDERKIPTLKEKYQ